MSRGRGGGSKFANEVRKFAEKAKARERLLFKRVAEHAFRSIRFGSNITGAPGQPVDTTMLLKSWRMRIGPGRNVEISSPLFYAPIIEDNRRGATLRSKVGGFHSVKLTRLGWQRMVEYELRDMGPNHPGDKNATPKMPAIGRTPQPRDKRGRFMRKNTADLRING